MDDSPTIPADSSNIPAPSTPPKEVVVDGGGDAPKGRGRNGMWGWTRIKDLPATPTKNALNRAQKEVREVFDVHVWMLPGPLPFSAETADQRQGLGGVQGQHVCVSLSCVCLSLMCVSLFHVCVSLSFSLALARALSLSLSLSLSLNLPLLVSPALSPLLSHKHILCFSRSLVLSHSLSLAPPLSPAHSLSHSLSISHPPSLPSLLFVSFCLSHPSPTPLPP